MKYEPQKIAYGLAIFLLMFLTMSPNVFAAPLSGFPKISVSKEIIASGEEVVITFDVPDKTIYAILHLSCPKGIRAYVDGLDWCNQDRLYNQLIKQQAVTFINLTSQALNVVPNFSVYTTQNPTYALGRSANILVGAHNEKVKTGTSSSPPVATFSLASKSPKNSIKAGSNSTLMEMRVTVKGKTPASISGITLIDSLSTLGDSLLDLTIYRGKKKISAIVSMPDAQHIHFDFVANPIIVNPKKVESLIIKGTFPKTLIGEVILLQLTGVAGYGNYTTKGIGTYSNDLIIE